MTPESWKRVKNVFRTALERVVGKALAQLPESRHRHASKMIVDLRAVAESLVKKKAAPGSRRRRATVVALTLILAVAIVTAAPGTAGPAQSA